MGRWRGWIGGRGVGGDGLRGGIGGGGGGEGNDGTIGCCVDFLEGGVKGGIFSNESARILHFPRTHIYIFFKRDGKCHMPTYRSWLLLKSLTGNGR